MSIKNNVNEIKIGTEFTFRKKGTNKNFEFSLDDIEKYGCSSCVKHSSMNEAYSKINRWIEMISKKCCCQVTEKKDESKGVIKTVKFDKMENQAIKDKDPLWEDFYIKFDLDVNCIELQTAPRDLIFWKKHSDLLDRLIFGIASELGMELDVSLEGGGGHISLDGSDSIGESAEYLINTLLIYNYVASDYDLNNSILEGIRDDITKHNIDQNGKTVEDDVNAPLMTKSQLQGLIKWFGNNKNVSYGATIEYIKKNYHNAVKEEMKKQITKKDKRIDEELGPYYQALSIATMNSSKIEERRLEFRRFTAQRSLNDLFDEIQGLFSIINRARQSFDDVKNHILVNLY